MVYTADSFYKWAFSQFRGSNLTVRFHKGDLPSLDNYRDSIAVDTETLGLNPLRDRLCVVQLSPGDGTADVVQIAKAQTEAPNLKTLMEDADRTVIFHFARFDVAVLKHALGIDCADVYCTKIASRLTRTYTDRHGLKDLVREFIGVDISKQQQSSDWAAETLSQAQLEYAATDVLHLHDLRAHLDLRLAREERQEIAKACFDFIRTRSALDLAGWADQDIFSHS